MGAWPDFLASQQNATAGSSGSGIYTRIPSPPQALKARPLRALLLAAGGIFTVTFVFAAFGGPGHETLTRTLAASKGYTSDAGNWLPSWGDGTTYARDSTIPGSNGQLLEPVYTKDAKSGLEYPPDIQPAKLNQYKRAKATYVSLVRNSELNSIKDSMRQVENAFNRKAGVSYSQQT